MKTLKTHINESMRMMDAGRYAYNELLRHKHIFTEQQWNQIEFLTAKAETIDEKNPEFPYLCLTKGPKYSQMYTFVMLVKDVSLAKTIEKEFSKLARTAERSQTIALYDIAVNGDAIKLDIEGSELDMLASFIEGALTICNKYSLI